MQEDVYFGGTILPPKPSDPTDAIDPTFRFSMSEKQNLNLKGVPIVMEHSTRERDIIGSVLNNYTLRDGETVIMGKLHGKSVKSFFAKRAINGDDPWYGSLSLCHAHRCYSDGSTEKIPKEVSLCKNPRRQGSDIFILDKQTTKKRYIKTIQNASKMAPSTSSAATTTAVEKKTAVLNPSDKKKEELNKAVSEKSNSVQVEVVHEAAVVDGESVKPDISAIAKLKQIIISQEKQLEMREQQLGEINKKADSYSAKLDVIHQAARAKDAAEKEAMKQRAELIAKSLVDSLQQELPDNINDDMKESFRVIAEIAPKHARAVYELMHEASVRHSKRHAEYEQSLKNAKHDAIQKEFDNVMSKRRAVHIPSRIPVKAVIKEVKHEAASADSWFRKAMMKNQRGSVRSNMLAVHEYNREKFDPPLDKRRKLY